MTVRVTQSQSHPTLNLSHRPQSSRSQSPSVHRPHSSRVAQITSQPTRYRVTLPPCETDGVRSQQTPKKNQISKLNSSRAGKAISTQATAVPAVAATALRARCAAAARFGNPSKLNISANPPKFRKLPPPAWSCRSQLQLSGRQPSGKSHQRPQSTRIALPSASHTTSNTSKRPARSRRRPFGVP